MYSVTSELCKCMNSELSMNSANVVVEIKFKFLNERALSTGKRCNCENVALLRSIHRGTLSIHWHTAQNLAYLLYSFYLDALQRRPCSMFSRFLKVAIATSNFMNEVYNGGFSPVFSVSMLKEIITLV